MKKRTMVWVSTAPNMKNANEIILQSSSKILYFLQPATAAQTVIGLKESRGKQENDQYNRL